MGKYLCIDFIGFYFCFGNGPCFEGMSKFHRVSLFLEEVIGGMGEGEGLQGNGGLFGILEECCIAFFFVSECSFFYDLSLFGHDHAIDLMFMDI